MIIDFVNANGGGGGGYVLPIASASVLGGVKVGSGLTIDNAGRLSTEAQSGASEDWAWYSVEEYNELSKNEKRVIYEEIKALVESGETKIGFYSYTEETDGYGNPILNYERYVFSHYQDEQIYFQGVFAYRNIEDDEDENGYFVSKCLRLDVSHMEWYNYDSIDGGGSGDSNYVIVDSLEDIDEPTEGLMASVRSYSSETSSNKIYISDIEAFSSDHGGIEGYLGHFLYTGSTPSDPNQSALYISGDQFNWDLENDGQWHTRTYDFDGSPVSIEYRTHNEPDGNAWFEYIPAENVTFSCENNVAETALTVTAWTAGKTCTYRINEWVQNGNVVVFKWNDIAPSTSAETVALRTMFSDMVDRGVIPSILRDNHVFNYSGSNSQWVNFEAVFGYNADWILCISGEKVEEEGFDSVGVRLDQNQFVYDQNQHTINLTSGGTFDNPDQLGKFSEESHTDTIIFKMDGDYGVWSQAPVKYVYRTRSQEEDPLVYYWSVEIPVNGTLYRGVWHATEGDWSNYTTDSWAAV